jgi:hypothetical protein
MKKYTQYVLVILFIFIIVVLLNDLIVFREGITAEPVPSPGPRFGQKPPGLRRPPGAPPQNGSAQQQDGSSPPQDGSAPPIGSTPGMPNSKITSRGKFSAVTKANTGKTDGKDACVVNPNSDDCAIQKCMGSKPCIKSVSENAAKVSPTAGANTDVDTSYSYVNFIKTPTDLKMSDKGSIKTLENDIEGLMAYVKLLIEGTSDASKAAKHGPLGNKFFINSGGKCNNVNSLDPTNRETDRYLYINNVPMGKIPFTTGLDNMEDFRGLIPGMMEHLDVIDPSNIMTAFSESGTPDCQEITMETIDSKNKVSSETHFVTLSDIKIMDACLFPADKNKKRINPVTKAECKEGFTGRLQPEDIYVSDYSYSTHIDYIINDISNDYISQLFLFSFGLFGIYLMTKSLKRMR